MLPIPDGGHPLMPRLAYFNYDTRFSGRSAELKNRAREAITL